MSVRTHRVAARVASSFDAARDAMLTAEEKLDEALVTGDPVTISIAQDYVLNAVASLTQAIPQLMRLYREIDEVS
jgi:hypothetical protein